VQDLYLEIEKRDFEIEDKNMVLRERERGRERVCVCVNVHGIQILLLCPRIENVSKKFKMSFRGVLSLAIFL
jgi:adenylate cyclase class IV